MIFLIIIDRCAREHPYQTIPIVYAIANSNIDQKYNQCEESTNNEEVIYIQFIIL